MLDKVGTFGILRYCLPLFPNASVYFAPLAIALALVGIIYAALLAVGQNDLKRLVSYTSVAHFGFIGVGIFAFTSQAGSGAVLYMVNHGLATGLLFLVIGMLVTRRGSALVTDFGGAGKLVPVLAGVLLFAGLASLALPGTAPFASEFLVLLGTFTVNKTVAVVATLGIILAAGYVLWMVQRTTQGTPNPELSGIRAMRKDMSLRESVVVAPLIALLLVLRLLSQATARRHQSGDRRHVERPRQVRPGADRTGGRTMTVGSQAPLAIDITLPALDYTAMAPMLILFGAACVGVLVEAFAARRSRFPVQFVLAFVALIAALIMVIRIWQSGRRSLTADIALAIDGPTLFLQGTLVVLGMIALFLVSDRTIERGGPFVAQAAITVGGEADRRQAREAGGTEVFPLMMFALGGMMLFVAANDLLTMFVALEVFSLPLYLLCALARRRRLVSQEAALKYFLLGAFASAFFIFGMALLYGFAGTVSLAGINTAALSATTSPLLLITGIAMVSVALLFKIAAVPFHVWTPDVYQGAPTPITALMAGCTKVAAFGGLLRVLYVSFNRVQWDIEPILGTVAIITMLVGAILAVTQTDIKRLLAYSSIANAGYLLVGVLAFSRDGLSSSMFYLAAYGFTVIAAFGVITLVRDDDGEATHLSRWAGLGQDAPRWWPGCSRSCCSPSPASRSPADSPASSRYSRRPSGSARRGRPPPSSPAS